MNLTYTTGIPATNNDPSVDQPNMQTNTNSVDSWVEIDHHGFGDNQGGYHTIVHQDTTTPNARTVNRTTSAAPVGFPSAIAGINQLFSALVTAPSGTDTQLFSLTGNNGLSQLTGNFTSSEGYCWCGGILIQWGGVVTSLNTTSSIVGFSSRNPNMINFPNSCFVVMTTPFYNSNISQTPDSQRTATVSINTFTLSRTQFTWSARSSSTSASNNYGGFYWVAIGN